MICQCGHPEAIHATGTNAARKCCSFGCECPGFKPILEPGIPGIPTLRDQFAMAALTGLIARGCTGAVIDEAFDIADEVMAARMKRKAKP